MSERDVGRGKKRRRRRVDVPEYCTCPKCEYKAPHIRGVPCLSVKCPNCGIALIPLS